MSVLPKEQQQQWAEHIQAWRDSGLSQQDYCQAHGLKSHQFWYWKRKLSGPCKPEAAKTQDSQPNTTNRFVPVNVSQPAYPSEGLVLTLPGGICLSGITLHNVSIARQLAEVLK